MTARSDRRRRGLDLAALLPIIGLLFGLVAGYLYSARSPVVYEAVATSYATSGPKANENSTAVAAEVQGLAQLGATTSVLEDAAGRTNGALTADRLAKTVTVKPRLNTVIIDTTAQASSPEEAALAANAVDAAMAKAVAKFSARDASFQPTLTLVNVTRAAPPSAPQQTNRLYYPLGLGLLGGIAGLLVARRIRTRRALNGGAARLD